MRLLDAAIAFAICIGGFATVVTVIVEILHRVLRLRARGLEETLEMVYADLIVPVARRAALKADKVAKNEVKTWVAAMRDSPLKGSGLDRWYPGALSGSNQLSKVDFLKRLADTPQFVALRQQLGPKTEGALNEFVATYETYGAAMSEYFSRRAQIVSLIAGVMLAIGANIDGIRLFERFLADSALAARMEAQSAQFQKALDKTKQTDQGKEAALADVQETAALASDLVSGYADLRLPIGWSYYPGCAAPVIAGASAVDPRCAQAGAKNRPCAKPTKEKDCKFIDALAHALTNDWSGLLTWFFTVLMTGLLIGLGGPFWFDLAKKVATFRDNARGGQKADTGTPPTPPTPPADAVAQTIAQIVARPVPPQG